MLKRSIYHLFLLLVGYIVLYSDDAKIIITGIAIFLIGMFFMEDGFKLFGGGIFEKVLQKSTDSLTKAISTGFIATSIIQSSSLTSVIVISFLSAELISLSGAIGIIFGSNIGSTTTSWIVATLGMKIDISSFAMPMVIFGVVLKFHRSAGYRGVGNVLLGIGLIFLGIDYMKEGFETLQKNLNLSEYAISGYLGILVYVLFGAIATIIIQSSAATMALVITAIVANQILYINAVEIAIGANIGTTVTAFLGSLASNSNGKRLAIAHFIFNMITAFVAIIFLYQLIEFVDILALKLSIADDDYAIKLALFHTLFNVIGVIIVSPFIKSMVLYLDSLFNDKEVSIAKYLDDAVTKIPQAAILALKKETEHLYDNAAEVLFHALSLHKHTLIGIDEEKISTVVQSSINRIDTDIDEYYESNIKNLYGDIIHYATVSQENMDIDDKKKIYSLKIASRDIVEAVKNVRELQKNINRYMKSNNSFIKNEYNYLREEIAKTLDVIYLVQKSEDDFEALAKIKILQESTEKLDMIRTGRIDTLIRNNNITAKMATSLINDASFAYEISSNIIKVAKILWIEDKDIQDLGES